MREGNEMTMTDHRTDIAQSWAGVVRDLRGMLALYSGDTDSNAVRAILRDYGYAPAELHDDGPDPVDVAIEVAGSYALAIETFRSDSGTVRVEMTLGLGGPTQIVTWDSRGLGWSSYFHSWGMLNGEDRHEWDMSESEHETVAQWLETFAGVDTDE